MIGKSGASGSERKKMYVGRDKSQKAIDFGVIDAGLNNNFMPTEALLNFLSTMYATALPLL